ncbi:probable disease resistance protein RXW24L [Nicotiana sylvestris]|uniref:probable disease resistance protein RXW24L n=1 Tax=Nicotiana sylvestris TaxID=4096 RepID=UPI00388C8158
MGYGSVLLLLENLERMLNEVKFLEGTVEEFKSELLQTKGLVKDAKVGDERVIEIVDEFRKILVETEDVIDTYAVDVGGSSGILKCVNCISTVYGRRKLESQLVFIMEQIHYFNEKLANCCSVRQALIPVSNHTDSNCSDYRFAYPFNKDVLVGLEEKKRTLQSLFQYGFKESPVIAICGMGGIGKTTLAWAMYDELFFFGQRFDAFAYIVLPHDFHIDMDFLLRDILTRLNRSSKKQQVLECKGRIELAHKVYESLESNKCFLVLEDMWSMDAWVNLSAYLPTAKSASRILVTTRNGDVAKSIAEKGVSFEMKRLSADECWEVLLKRQPSFLNFFKANQVLEEIAKAVVSKCFGLPLAVVCAGSVLAREHSVAHWKSVLQNFDSYLYLEKDTLVFSKIPKTLLLTYHYLPYHLQSCFLYLGLFPKGVDIEAEKLFNLWVAEGFVASENGESETTLIDRAEHYLYQLVAKNLICMQEEEGMERVVRNCPINDLLREHCLLKGKEENVFEVLHLAYGPRKDSYGTTRRLSVFLDECEAGNDVCLQQKVSSKVRSLLFLNPYPNRHALSWPRSFSLKNFRLLRVLDFEDIRFQGKGLPEGIEKLTNLKYLSLRNCYVKELPSFIGELSNLRTLDLRVNDVMTIPNVLWKLKKLRHLYLPYSFQVCGVDKLRLESMLLETLKNYRSYYCDAKDLFNLHNLCNLRYLGASVTEMRLHIIVMPKISSNCTIFATWEHQLQRGKGGSRVRQVKPLP